MSFKSILNRNTQDVLAKTKEKIAAQNKGSFEKDPTFWKPKFDKETKSSGAVIRFLPVSEADMARDPEALPWVSFFRHQFNNKATNKFYSENSLTSINQPDPVNEHCSACWAVAKANPSDKSLEAEARRFNRKQVYVANVLVVKHPSNPSDEGKVFRMEFGPKIFEKIQNAMFPPQTGLLEEDSAFDPFDMLTGANFVMSLTTPKGSDIPNYDNSKFGTPGPISKDEEKLEEIYNLMHPLLTLTDPDKFKSYDELAAKMASVLGTTRATTTVATPAKTVAEVKKKATPAPKAVQPTTPVVEESESGEVSGEDFDSMFADISIDE